MADEALTNMPTPRVNRREPKSKPGPFEYLRRWPLQVIVGAVLAFSICRC